MDTCLPILVLFLLTFGAMGGIVLLSIFTGPRRHSKVKSDPFECGTLGTGNPHQRMGVKFYLVAMIFILFDIEIVFLFPWAVRAKEMGWNGFALLVGFLSVIALGLAYVWKRGVLDWK